VHGELFLCMAFGSSETGSSPRAWGTLVIILVTGAKYRFIPTCMGNSKDCSCLCFSSSVHPHVHGELRPPPDVPHAGAGSSPRAWGTQLIDAEPALVERFIPTCMGNSVQAIAGACRRSVHPHVHGELVIKSPQWITMFGSSPRAWGTHKYD